MAIVYRTLTPEDVSAIAAAFGSRIERLRVLHFEADCYTLGAFDEGCLVGIISTYPKKFPEPLPLGGRRDAYIDLIEVEQNHRRQGIAAAMIAMTEDWARAQGYRQIRSWSSANKTEAIPMWYALGYCLCPACPYAAKPNRKLPNGYYVAKLLGGKEKL